ncbi:hypothetical protein NQ314_010264 [Rhamnusium bicolor]|uniref:COMM domain-containing protein n=1 Tax=Rhamnusium bicolor TaxID=1586634 RepID=A0AAV8XRZ8_9CUCU|nr:hypothetical protein NQ314_010264 [Rhamnusium bicolor]
MYLGRLVLKARENEGKSSINLTELISPRHFNYVVQCVKELCGEIVPSNTINRPEFNIPSLALKLGHSIKKCVNILRGMDIKAGLLLRDKEHKAFGKLIDMEWSLRISSQACSTLNTRKMNSPNILPLTEDLIKLMKYQSKKIKELSLTLKKLF